MAPNEPIDQAVVGRGLAALGRSDHADAVVRVIGAVLGVDEVAARSPEDQTERERRQSIPRGQLAVERHDHHQRDARDADEHLSPVASSQALGPDVRDR